MNKICPIPWIHLNINPSGDVYPCCLMTGENNVIGNLNHQSIDDIWNNDFMKSLRREFIGGAEPEVCKLCFDREKSSGISSRIHKLKRFESIINEIPDITLPDGTCTEMKLKYWDFRFSNICNFKCRSCGPSHSSSWVYDHAKIYQTPVLNKIEHLTTINNTHTIDYLKEQIPHVERINFAGGEPMLMAEHWEILNLLIEHERFDVFLSYNTNCSTLEYNNKHATDYWKHWESGKIDVAASIDEIGDRAELIRSGTKWTKIEHNLIELSNMPNVLLRPSITVGAWNVFRLPEIITHLTHIGVIRKVNTLINYNNFHLNLLFHPSHYHVHILPDEYKTVIIEKLRSFVDMYNHNYNTSIDLLFSQTLFELSKPYDEDAAKSFIEISDKIDNIRHENIFNIIPELKIIKKKLKSTT